MHTNSDGILAMERAAMHPFAIKQYGHTFLLFLFMILNE